MNIVLIGPYFPYRGGISDTNLELCETLKDLGHNVKIISFKLLYPSLLFPGKSQFVKKNSKQKISSQRIINSINPLNWIFTCKLINDINPELVISTYWTPFLSPSLSFINNKINKNIFKIGIIHNAYPHEKKLFQKTFLKFFLNSINKYVALSKNVYKQVNLISRSKKGKELFHPIPNKFGEPINKEIAKKKIGLKTNYKYLLFFGLIRKYKGLEILINSMAEITRNRKDIKLLIVGENYESINRYKKLINKNNLENSIYFVNNFIDQKDVKYWFCSSELIIQPYIKASQSGITPLSFQFETPTVCTNIPGLSDQIINNINGFISEPNSRNLAQQILIALNTNLTNIKKEIRKKKLNLTWKNFVIKLLKETKNDK